MLEILCTIFGLALFALGIFSFILFIEVCRTRRHEWEARRRRLKDRDAATRSMIKALNNRK